MLSQGLFAILAVIPSTSAAALLFPRTIASDECSVSARTKPLADNSSGRLRIEFSASGTPTRKYCDWFEQIERQVSLVSCGYDKHDGVEVVEIDVPKSITAEDVLDDSLKWWADESGCTVD